MMTGENHLHIIEKGAVQKYSNLVHGPSMFQHQKKQYQCRPKVFCLRDRTQIIQLHMSGKRNMSFLQGELISNAF